MVFFIGAMGSVRTWAAGEDRVVLSPVDASRSAVPSSPDLKPLYHYAIGVSYTGGQLRYRFSSRWAAETRFQYGKAESHYGDVTATVFGLRGYRFFPLGKVWAWYCGSEAAYAEAKAQESSYRTSGFALGGFGGMEYAVNSRLALGMDIGPYVITLKEKQSQLSSTNLDFVANGSLTVFLF